MSHRQSHDLGMSFRAVSRARSALARARAQGSLRGATAVEQRELLAALEDCASAMTRHGHPIPYRMHGELAMYRAMFGHTPPQDR